MTHHFTIISIVTTRRTITFNKKFEIQENIHSAIYTMYLKLKHLRSMACLHLKWINVVVSSYQLTIIIVLFLLLLLLFFIVFAFFSLIYQLRELNSLLWYIPNIFYIICLAIQKYIYFLYFNTHITFLLLKNINRVKNNAFLLLNFTS